MLINMIEALRITQSLDRHLGSSSSKVLDDTERSWALQITMVSRIPP